MIYLFSAQSSDQIWHYLYTKEKIYMFVFSHTDTKNPIGVRYWIHHTNMVTETNWYPLWLDYIPCILNIVDITQMYKQDLHHFIDDTITLRILESI